MTEYNESNWEGLEHNELQRENKLWNVMVGNTPNCTERNCMYHNIKFLLWIMTGDDGSDCDGLERNVLQLYNMLWNVIGVDESYWDGKELNVLQCERFDMEFHGK